KVTTGGPIPHADCAAATRTSRMGALRRARNVEKGLSAPAEACRLHGVSRDVAGGSHALHAPLEIVGIRGIFQSRFVIHQSGLEQIPQRLIKRLHAVL